MKIEIAFATPSLQKIIAIDISAELTISEIIRLSKLQDYFPEYNLQEMPYGICGKRVYPETNVTLKENDRIEIYRPLNLSPNQKRLARAKNK